MKKIKPETVREHTVGNGIQKLYRFLNGWGASVVRFKLPYGDSYGSYTDNNKEWELAVIRWLGEGEGEFTLDYTSGITDDVIGHLSDKEVEETLIKIRELEPWKNEKEMRVL